MKEMARGIERQKEEREANYKWFNSSNHFQYDGSMYDS